MTDFRLLPRFVVTCAPLTAVLAAFASGQPAASMPAPAPSTAATAAEASHQPTAHRSGRSSIAGTADATTVPVGELERLVRFGDSLGERGDYVGAESALRQVLNAPAAPVDCIKGALLALAHMHRRQGALTKAAAIYERFLKDYPGDDRVPEALLDLGRTLRSLGVYKLALARFYSVINSTLKLPGEGFNRYQALAKTAQFEIAETYFLAGDFTEATKFYSRLGLLELAATDRGEVQFKAAYARRLQGDLAGAVVTLRSFLEQWPNDANVPEARYLLALTLRELNRPQEAFRETLQLLQTAKSVCAEDPKRWAYWQRRTGNQLANDFFESGDTINAQTIYAGLLELSPEPAWRLPTMYQLGLCYERLGQLERARASYQGILDGATAVPPPDIVELVRMAGWRIEHLAWREHTARQLSSLLETTTGKQAASVSSPAPPTAAMP